MPLAGSAGRGATAPDAELRRVLGPQGFHHAGGPAAVLLIHGLTGTPAEMRFVGSALARRGYTVACPQLAGHCGSVAELKATRWQDWYASVERALEALAARHEQVFVAGLSMGALLALELAARRPEKVAGLALLSAIFFFDGWNVPKWRQRLLLPLVLHTPLRYFLSWEEKPPYGIKDEHARRLVTAILENRDARTADKIGHFNKPATVLLEGFRLIRAARASLPAVHAPTLIVHAQEDDMASTANAEFIARSIAARTVETCLLDDTYHVLVLDRRRHEVAARMASFFAGFMTPAAGSQAAPAA